ncbi:MAG: hypothetical protein DHS20C21_24650 [Gemmatimonadota bacterium]|nr:MAG: hypothetical protein DHS20C21_24650 [Gemmatimonadota bacterium]
MLRTTLSLILIIGALGAPVSAQTGDVDSGGETPSVEKLVADALAAHKAGKSMEAIQHLQAAIDAIQQVGTKSLTSFLPPVPEDWNATEPKTINGNWGSGAQAFQWSQVTRTYTTKDGMRVSVTFSNSPQLIASQRQMAATFGNEQMVKMMNMDPNKEIKVFKKEGWNGWTIVEKNKASGVAFGDKIMVSVDLNRGTEEVFSKFWKQVDFDGLRGAK